MSRALTFTIANGKIAEIEVIGDPARLGELDVSIIDVHHPRRASPPELVEFRIDLDSSP